MDICLAVDSNPPAMCPGSLSRERKSPARPGYYAHSSLSCVCGSSNDRSQVPRLGVELYIGKVLASHPTFEAAIQVH